MGVTLSTTPCHRVAVTNKEGFPDPQAEKLAVTLRHFFKIHVESIKILHIYSIHKAMTWEQLSAIAAEPLRDSVVEVASLDSEFDPEYDWGVEVSLKSGLTDNAGSTAKTAIEDFFGVPFHINETVHASVKYLFKGDVEKADVARIASELLANPLIHDVTIQGRNTLPEGVEEIVLCEENLERVSRERQLGLTLREMRAIRDYYSLAETGRLRSQYGLSQNPTDVELETLAQTWSEHCKHKIFHARIAYEEDGRKETIDSLFKTYIKRATQELASKIGWLVSVFTDNAGIIRFNSVYNLAFKVETHNSPSALDPYGGALTGILGVNRDILGAGIGARLLANTDVFCFASPDYNLPVPKRLLHPKRIFEGVRHGVEHGGNKSGVPTVNGAIVFDERYLGKPLVYCGTVGIMPAMIRDRPTHIKEIVPGDLIVIAGGRTGKDGIHGAIFSSEALHAGSPSTAVQIGDPFTQKKLHDFILEARDAGLYRTLTDNGAGGFASSVGELATLSGGCDIHLDRALLKYPGMRPWEILLSESQERMTLAADPSHWEALCALAEKHEVEIFALGTFTNTGSFHAQFRGQTVALLSLPFLHGGLPQMELTASWQSHNETPFPLPNEHLGGALHRLLARYNICSKESIIRQYDHEVQGGSCLKPLVGINSDGPSDAAIVRPIECVAGKEGVVIANGICPRYSDLDAYHMAACAVDEAVRNAIAVGADPKQIAILDNFCWPDPVGDFVKTAQLVRACRALYACASAFETPIISGKDSMKNDYHIDGVKISVPPTLLISAIGKIHDVETAISMDVKAAGDLIYVVGLTKNELGASEYACMHGLQGGIVPKVDLELAKTVHCAMHNAISKGWVASCHDCSDGGLAVALAEKAFAGGLGLTVDLRSVPTRDAEHNAEILFSESPSRYVVTIDPVHAKAFEAAMRSCPCARVGKVDNNPVLTIYGRDGTPVITEEIGKLKDSWQKPLGRGGLL